VQILYFAWVRQKIGLAEEQVTPPEQVRDVAGLIAWLAARSPGHAAAFADQEFCAPDAPVAPGDEVAFFPPVTGG